MLLEVGNGLGRDVRVPEPHSTPHPEQWEGPAVCQENQLYLLLVFHFFITAYTYKQPLPSLSKQHGSVPQSTADMNVCLYCCRSVLLHTVNERD